MSGYYSKTFYKAGQWNAVCDVCGFEYKSGELKLRWDGLMTCPGDWEMRNPQDLMKAPPPERAIPWSRPEGQDVFIQTGELCTFEGRTAIAGVGVAGCMIASYNPSV